MDALTNPPPPHLKLFLCVCANFRPFSEILDFPSKFFFPQFLKMETPLESRGRWSTLIQQLLKIIMYIKKGGVDILTQEGHRCVSFLGLTIRGRKVLHTALLTTCAWRNETTCGHRDIGANQHTEHKQPPVRSANTQRYVTRGWTHLSGRPASVSYGSSGSSVQWLCQRHLLITSHRGCIWYASPSVLTGWWIKSVIGLRSMRPLFNYADLP